MTTATSTADTADSSDARTASMSRVETQETLLAKLATEPTAQESSEAKAAAKADDSQDELGQGNKGKQKANERIASLANKRREAEERANASENENRTLKERLKALETSAPTLENSSKPSRSHFTSDDDYIEALTDWKANDAIIKREQQQREAKLNAEAQQIDQNFHTRLESAMKEIDDFAEVVGNADVVIPDFIVMAIKESEVGPMLTYYLAKHPDEARKIASMRPVQAVKQLMSIERELSDEPVSKSEPVKIPEKKRAPEPISPVKGTTTVNPGVAKNFEEYKARRLAEKRK